MSNVVITSSTFVRHLSRSTLRKLADFLDPGDTWKRVLEEIHKPSGEPRYTQLHLRRFEGLVAQGKSPTIELLYDWGTTNCTVGELVDILLKHQLFAPASVLLPDVCTNHKAKVHHASPSHQETAQHPGPLVLQKGEEETPLPDSTTDPEEHSELSDTGFLRFTYQELMKITGNWDERPVSQGGCRLGEGGFGIVFKGIRRDTYVAVKKLHAMDDISPEELKNQFSQEIQTLMALKHENLVNMVGFSSDGQHPCLVYAYMPNGSLLDRLACLEGSPPLSWRKRCEIAVGTAKGLEYLHCNHHVHRDVKSGNILLDKMFVPKISDFGLTRASAKRSSSTVMTERIVGTTAYMAPEALRGEITPKSDIFSFGVVLLEIISGLPPVDENRDPQLLMEMRDEIDEEEMSLEEFVDKKMGDWNFTAIEKIYSVASQCLNDKKNRRPLIKEVQELSTVKSLTAELIPVTYQIHI
ncbi:interleukin-1 receptor-associated kinase 4 [Chanos chanos]|uniref:Interleukin-1 receptor-associated kinase 4 n=1 Tax=Chanos chanos TaxID=29144 RepID=A0A6J2VEV2_CHACN|nr:interleukin-1 receptor-associated kinase 4 [Chanos chanos]